MPAPAATSACGRSPVDLVRASPSAFPSSEWLFGDGDRRFLARLVALLAASSFYAGPLTLSSPLLAQ